MYELSPVDEDSIEFYRSNADYWARLADAVSVRHFSDFTRHELRSMVGAEGAYLVEALARLANYADEANLRNLDRAVSRRLRVKGLARPKGKRSGHGLRAMVGGLTPMFLFFGLPMAYSERSKLVRALRTVADEMGIRGDPRDELRRLLRVNRENKSPDGYGVFLEACARGIAPD